MSEDPKHPSRSRAAEQGGVSAASNAPQPPAAELIPPLKKRHRRFVLEYVIDLNGVAAARRAGYARGKASELLRRSEVQLAIRAEMKERDQRLRLASERIVGEVMCIAFADPGRWRRARRFRRSCGRGPPSGQMDLGGGRKGETAQRFEMHDKLAALELLACMTGLLTRAPGRGRFALLQEDEERASRDARAELRARLMRIVHGQHEDIATTPATRSGTAENETQSDDRCGGGATGG